MTRTEPGLVGALLEGRYRVDRMLARGGMSAVYRGLDTRLDRPVAIKVMDPRFADDRSFVERFQLEARAAAALHHPNVVAVHDQGVDHADTQEGEDRAFLVMELVDGDTLRRLLDTRGALDVHTALSVVEPVLCALAAAHGAGLVHRDIKPENVLIGHGWATGPAAGEELVKVADFGLVRAVAGSNSTNSSVILGTVAYLSPEQVTTGSAGERGDVYSTGILLYEMLTGAPPYDGDTALSVAYRHVNDDVPPPSGARPGLPPALDALVLRATRRDPDARPADAAAFLLEVRGLRTELGIDLVSVPIPDGAQAGASLEPEERDSEPTVPAMRAVTGAVHTHEHAGPRGTRAMRREPLAQQEAQAPSDPPAKRGRGRKWLALWVVLGLLLVGGGGAAWWLNARWTAVPQVAGMSKAQAHRTLTDADLAAQFIRERHNTVPKGTVIRTSPAGGSEVLPGDGVTVVVSAGKPVVPEIPAGTSAVKAERMIREAQLTPRRDPAANRYSADVPKGAVLTVAPAPGSEANIGDPVTLVLSKGPPPTPVPELTGKAKAKAFELLRAKGFEPFVADKKFSEKVAGGRVIKTDPPAGTRGGVDGSMRVGVYLSTAVQVPSLRGKSIEDAAEILHEAELKAKFEGVLRGGGEHDNDHDNGHGNGHGRDKDRFGFVISQDPDPGTLVKPGSTVRLKTVP